MLNQVVLTGNLGADPEVFYSSEGNPVASFNIAFRCGKQKTGWIKIVCFQKLAEVAQKYLHKGTRVAVIGTLDHHKWETDEGVQMSMIAIIEPPMIAVMKPLESALKASSDGFSN